MPALRGGCRPLQPTRPTPSWHRRQAIPPQGFGLLPVRSPLLRESSLFLGVLRCFSSPGALLEIALQVPGRAPGGLPHSDIPGSPAASASPGHFAAWPRPSSAANAKASTMRPSCGYPAAFPSGDRDPRPQTGTRQRDGPVWPHLLPRRSDAPRGFVCCCCCVVALLYGTCQCARASRHEPPPHQVWCNGRLRSSEAHLGPCPGTIALSRGRRTLRVPRGALSKCRRPKGRRGDPKVVVATTSPSS